MVSQVCGPVAVSGLCISCLASHLVTCFCTIRLLVNKFEELMSKEALQRPGKGHFFLFFSSTKQKGKKSLWSILLTCLTFTQTINIYWKRISSHYLPHLHLNLQPRLHQPHLAFFFSWWCKKTKTKHLSSHSSKLKAKPLYAFHRQLQVDVHYAAEGRLSEGPWPVW